MEQIKSKKHNVLVIDDDKSSLHLLRKLVSDCGYDVTTTNNGNEGVEKMMTEDYDVIVSDIVMPKITGHEMLRSIRKWNPDLPVIFVTGEPNLKSAIDAVDSGAFAYLTKPVNRKQLKENLERAVISHDISREKRSAVQQARDSIQVTESIESNVSNFESALKSIWIAYQPIVSWTSRSVMGYEALLRCNEPSLSQPLKFLKVAENLNRVHEVGRIVRRKVANECESLEGNLKIFNNLHPLDLTDDDLFSQRSPFASHADKLVIEVMERKALDTIADAKEKIKRLSQMGFSIAIDDMGAGYSGLSSFSEYDASIVKLDMTLTRDVDKDERKHQVTKALIGLCTEMGTQVIAEGVETVDECQTLLNLGCDLFQGFLFGHPNPKLITPSVYPEINTTN